MIAPSSPEKIQQVQDALRAQMTPQEPPKIANSGAVASIVEGDVFEFPAGSGIHFYVPPVHYLKGGRLEKVALQLQEVRRERPVTAASVDRRTALQALAIRELTKLVRPAGRWRRLLWPIFSGWWSPFRHCTDKEVAELLLFFFSLTTKSRVRFSVRPTS